MNVSNKSIVRVGKFPVLLVSSFALAVFGFYWGPGRWLLYSGSGDVPNGVLLTQLIGIAWTWIILFVLSIMFYRWRALWLLFGAPFVLFWPCMWIFVAHKCNLFGC